MPGRHQTHVYDANGCVLFGATHPIKKRSKGRTELLGLAGAGRSSEVPPLCRTHGLSAQRGDIRTVRQLGIGPKHDAGISGIHAQRRPVGGVSGGDACSSGL
jgi:hypothetical protein